MATSKVYPPPPHSNGLPPSPHANYIHNKVLETDHVGRVHGPNCNNLPVNSIATGHVHGPNCGHLAVVHDDHIDYLLENGYFESVHHESPIGIPHLLPARKEHVMHNCRLELPDLPDCAKKHKSIHDECCGYQKVRHDDHFDYLINGELHHLHGDHCDSHGFLPFHTPLEEKSTSTPVTTSAYTPSAASMTSNGDLDDAYLFLDATKNFNV